ncbi:MAG: hypothetical protein K2I93_01325, partial [Oscillospiraceae bacterium]|nr:hypothetical protein [Oscillospiraceae bacterium]
MKNFTKKVLAICLAASFGTVIAGCSRQNDQSVPDTTISLDQTKHELTFNYKTNNVSADATEASEDATEAKGDAAEDTTAAEVFEEVTQYVNVTDAVGQNVTDAAGTPETQAVVVETRPVNNGNANNNNNGDNNNNNNNNGNSGDNNSTPSAGGSETTAQPSYSPAYDTCKAYWLDMSRMGDYVFNGEFLVIEFEVNQDIPDGSYPVTFSMTDIASWDLVQYEPVKINGEVAVNTNVTAQDALPDSDFG